MSVVFGPGVGPHGRLSFTRGAVSARGRVVHGIPYRPDAIVPAAGWRPATPEQTALLCGEHADGDSRDGETIAVVRAGEAVLGPLARLGLATATTVEEANARLLGPAYPEALRQALPALAELLASADGVRLLGTCVQPGGLVSTTTHTDEQGITTFSGLHVDDWDGLALGERGNCYRQMSINLGREDRFFVFAGIPVDRLARELPRLRAPLSSAGSYVGVGAAVFTERPDTVLYRVHVRPGEAYIAPTDNLIHDGSTEGNTAPDVTLSLRGRFLTRPGARRGAAS